MKGHVAIWIRCAAGLLVAALVGSDGWAAPKKVLVVTVTKGFRHSSIPTAEKVLGELAQRSGDFTVDYARTDQDLSAKMNPGALQSLDGVIFANTTGDLPIPDRAAFLDWVKSGKAFVGMHSCSDTYHGYPAFIEMLGGEFQTHHEQVEVQCLNQDPAHPATRHFGASYVVHDEIYLLKSFKREAVHGLLTLDKHPNTKMPGDHPIAWCKKAGQGNVFYTSLGHREDVWEAEPYQKHVLGGIKWALGLEPGDAVPQSTEVRLSEPEKNDGFVALFNGKDLSGWKLRNPDGLASWSAQNGMLVNTIPAGKHGTDLVSEQAFSDFVIRCEYMVPKGANSGLYLRGRYEVQVLEDFDNKQPGTGSNGAIYSVKAPSQFASRKAGEWQEVEATMQGNRISVTLNGVKIHDNVAVDRATGGQLDSNLSAPGPILLQGDHGAVAFRNIRIKPLH